MSRHGSFVGLRSRLLNRTVVILNTEHSCRAPTLFGVVLSCWKIKPSPTGLGGKCSDWCCTKGEVCMTDKKLRFGRLLLNSNS